MTQVAQPRLDRDHDKDTALIAETMKLIGNSSYGKLITNKENIMTLYMSLSQKLVQKSWTKTFNSLTELPNGYYKVENTKKKIGLDLRIHLGVFILNHTKLPMLEFYYDFLDYCLYRKNFDLLEMDTDSNELGILAENMENLIKPEFREEFERNRHL